MAGVGDGLNQASISFYYKPALYLHYYAKKALANHPHKFDNYNKTTL